ncbi:hypothetical protein [Planctomyces sp. SH-PL62]|uniref:hypothetical protein n=1 Tax=Planctomyces sp. SH-PL62 TaxID=1636152 RepID=UPI0012E82BA1|nr:hypothetical protein [Planctomyces sp. SH-PL62]
MKISQFETAMGLLTCLGIAYLAYDHLELGGEPKVQGLSGYVSIDGKPMTKGTVRFISADPDLPLAYGGYISNGRYEVPAEYGLVPARYTVEFSSIRNDDVNRMLEARARGEEVELKEEIPPRFNLQSDVQIDLTSGGVLAADFNLDRAADRPSTDTHLP